MCQVIRRTWPLTQTVNATMMTGSVLTVMLDTTLIWRTSVCSCPRTVPLLIHKAIAQAVSLDSLSKMDFVLSKYATCLFVHNSTRTKLNAFHAPTDHTWLMDVAFKSTDTVRIGSSIQEYVQNVMLVTSLTKITRRNVSFKTLNDH